MDNIKISFTSITIYQNIDFDNAKNFYIRTSIAVAHYIVSARKSLVIS